ncbi:MAG TPA: hypothetical protein PLK55_00505 [archaeon]|jgi:hypothetical protein|nr:hypothetical protein [archaeon]
MDFIMIDATLIKDTITELLEANVDKETIYQTLKDIGVEDSEIDKYYKEATTKEKEQKTETKNPESKPESHPKIETASPKILENIKTEEAIHQKPKATTEDLEKATKDVIDSSIMENQEIDEKITKEDNTQILEINNTNLEIKKQISELENNLGDIKAQINGLTKIMKDILEENRNILNKLK